jgi:hypothetical protein
MGAYLDQELLYRTLEISYRHRINEIVETGTSDGYSTAIMAQCFQKVHTIEIIPETYNLAQQTNLKNFSNVDAYLGNSTDILKNILIPNNNNYIFFLDAHWEEYCPLQDELKIIKEKNIISPIIIHDFFVPDFFNGGRTSRFSYDSYHGQSFTLEWLWEDIVNIYGKNNFHYYYNVSPTSEFSGILFLEPLIKT